MKRFTQSKTNGPSLSGKPMKSDQIRRLRPHGIPRRLQGCGFSGLAWMLLLRAAAEFERFVLDLSSTRGQSVPAQRLPLGPIVRPNFSVEGTAGQHCHEIASSCPFERPSLGISSTVAGMSWAG